MGGYVLVADFAHDVGDRAEVGIRVLLPNVDHLDEDVGVQHNCAV